MRRFLLLLLYLSGLLLTGCASDQILRIRSLEKTVKVEDRSENSGNFSGIDGVRRKTAADNINILFVHGIGWTQEFTEGSNSGQFGKQLAEALSSAYGDLTFDWNKLENLCPASSLDETARKKEMAKLASVLTIHRSTPNERFFTDDPLKFVSIYDLGCLDRIVIRPKTGPSISIYRFFWDDALWDSIEWPHARADGPNPRRDGNILYPRGMDYTNDLRTPNNAALKTPWLPGALWMRPRIWVLSVTWPGRGSPELSVQLQMPLLRSFPTQEFNLVILSFAGAALMIFARPLLKRRSHFY